MMIKRFFFFSFFALCVAGCSSGGGGSDSPFSDAKLATLSCDPLSFFSEEKDNEGVSFLFRNFVEKFQDGQTFNFLNGLNQKFTGNCNPMLLSACGFLDAQTLQTSTMQTVDVKGGTTVERTKDSTVLGGGVRALGVTATRSFLEGVPNALGSKDREDRHSVAIAFDLNEHTNTLKCVEEFFKAIGPQLAAIPDPKGEGAVTFRDNAGEEQMVAIDFGETQLGQQKVHPVSVLNFFTDGTPLNISKVSSNHPGITFSRGDCPQVLNGGESCQFNIVFRPASLLEGDEKIQTRFQIFGAEENTPSVSIDVAGEAVEPFPILEFDEKRYFNSISGNFPGGFLGDIISGGLVAKVRNKGFATAENIKTEVARNSDFFVTKECRKMLPPGASCEIFVSHSSFVTVGVVQHLSGELIVESNNSIPRRITADLNVTITIPFERRL